MDHYDRKILKLLIENCRYSTARIAKAVNLSKDSVKYRIRRMENQKIITNYSTMFNPRGLGYTVNHILLKLKSILPEEEKNIIKKVTKHPNVTFVSQHSGSFDMQVIFHTISAFHKEKIIEQVISMFKGKITDYKLVDHIRDYNFSFLFADVDVKINVSKRSDMSFAKELIGLKEKTQGFPKQISIFDEVDKKIMKILKGNARASLTDIGKQIGMTGLGVKKRIKSIIKKEGIVEFTLFPDFTKFGYFSYMLLFKIDNLPKSIERKLKAFLITKNIFYAARYNGAYNMFVYILAKDPVDFTNVYKELKSIIDDYIITYDLSIMTNIHKFAMISDEFLEKK